MNTAPKAACLDENQAVAFVSGTAAANEARRVDAHLDECDDCRQVVAALAKVSYPSLPGATGPTTPALDATVLAPGQVTPSGSGPQDLPGVGHTLAERFRLVRFLGRGGMGVVYEAEDQLLHARVAIKLLLPHIVAQPGLLPQLHREILLGRRISHPNVCRLHELLTSGSLRFIIMECVDGETLDVRLARGRLPLGRALHWLDGICSALEAAHKEGIVHRDLKPSNIMLTRAGVVKVMDFGLARDIDATSRVTGPVGTPAYWAPEQARGGATTPMSDVYALGLIAYQMIVGQALVTDDKKTLDALPPELRSIISRCVKQTPTERYADAGTLRLALQHARHASRRTAWRVPVLTVATAALLGLGVAKWYASSSATTARAPKPQKPTVSRPAAQAVAPPTTEAPALPSRTTLQDRLTWATQAIDRRFVDVDSVAKIYDLLGSARGALAGGDLAATDKSLREVATLLNLPASTWP